MAPARVLSAIGGAVLAGCSTVPAPDAAASLPSMSEFCAAVQHYMAGTSLPVINVVQTDYEAFVLSKAQVKPLETQQFAWPVSNTDTTTKMLSCKMKTADHIRAEYGEAAAGEEQTCAGYNRLTYDAVLAGFSGAERKRLAFDGGRNVVFDPDELTTSGPVWLEPYAMVYVGADGALHVKGKGMRNDWTDPRYFNAPVRFRGTRYCHLIAPDYLRDLLTGAQQLAPE
jgi:hypothetical protein